MQRMIVTGPVLQLHSGILELTNKQAASRMPFLSDLGEGLYQIEKPVQFKTGEEIGYDGEVNKALSALFEEHQPASGKRGKKTASDADNA